MTRVETPVEGFTGEVAGVAFADGVGNTDNPNALNYFRRHGYKVGAAEAAQPDGPALPDGDPAESWTAAQLKAYAAAHDIDLGTATKKADVWAAIDNAVNTSDSTEGADAGADQGEQD